MADRAICAVALLASAVIHFSVVPENAGEWIAEGVFFVVLGVVEVALALAALGAPRRFLPTVSVVGIVVSVGTIALWLVSRTIGLPFGPDRFNPETIETADAVATALEVVTAMAFFRLAASARTPAAPDRLRL